MAEVAAVYDATPTPRTPADILPTTNTGRANALKAPRAANKWLTASVVDAQHHQIDRINTEAAARDVTVPILIDFIHDLRIPVQKQPGASTPKQTPPPKPGYAATPTPSSPATHPASHDPCAEPPPKPNSHRPTRRRRHLHHLPDQQSPLPGLPAGLGAGWPIATGIIAGTCRHLVKDRMDLTGARWGLPGAEAILQLRAPQCNGDFDEYWTYHLAQEHHRNHQTRYANNTIPQAA